MARKSLRPHLNQIRGWVRQGRTDAWIAHQLEVSANELREFRRRHELEDETERLVRWTRSGARLTLLLDQVFPGGKVVWALLSEAGEGIPTPVRG